MSENLPREIQLRLFAELIKEKRINELATCFINFKDTLDKEEVTEHFLVSKPL